MVTIGANRTFWTVNDRSVPLLKKTQLEWPLARLCFRNRLVVVPFFNIAGDKVRTRSLKTLMRIGGKARFMPDARFGQIVEKIESGLAPSSGYLASAALIQSCSIVSAAA
jgi:hypothetical protein